MKMFTDYLRRVRTFNTGVVHATFDPDGPGVVRLHLKPPKAKFWSDPPSTLIINGTYFLHIGHSWATILSEFCTEINKQCPVNREISTEEVVSIKNTVVKRVSRIYPTTKANRILKDLDMIVQIFIDTAQNKTVPSNIWSSVSLEKYAKNMTAPDRMDLIVAPMAIEGKRACQLNCACCYADCQKTMDVKEILTTWEWKAIIDQCKKIGIPMLTFTGGEPLTRHDIVKLVKHAKWFVTRLNTNGYALTSEMAKELFEASLDGIQVTLYSSDSSIHDRLVGKNGAWEKTVAGIKNAIEAGLCVSVNTPLMAGNKDYDNTLRFLNSLGIHFVTCSGLIYTGNAKNLSINDGLTSNELKNILVEAKKVLNELGMEISFTSPGCFSFEEIEEIGLPSTPVCGACLSNMAITPSGDVVPCQSWLNGLTLGNFMTVKWQKIWNSQNCRKIRTKNALKPKCPLKEV